jgi:hypothetical protein
MTTSDGKTIKSSEVKKVSTTINAYGKSSLKSASKKKRPSETPSKLGRPSMAGHVYELKEIKYIDGGSSKRPKVLVRLMDWNTGFEIRRNGYQVHVLDAYYIFIDSLENHENVRMVIDRVGELGVIAKIPSNVGTKQRYTLSPFMGKLSMLK